MALVSSSWIFKDEQITFCYWPGYLKSSVSREKAVRNHTPLIKEKCLKCLITVKAMDVDYEKACRKLKRLEEESELSSGLSSTNEENPHNRKKNKNKYSDFYYESEESEIQEINPPKFPQTKVISPEHHKFSDSEDDDDYDDDSGNLTITEEKNTKKASEEYAFPARSNNISKSATNSKYTCNTCSGITIKLLEHLVREVTEVKIDVKNLSQAKNNEKITQFEALDKQLHIKTYEEAVQFNEKLCQDAEYFSKLQLSLSLLGGRDLNDTSRKLIAMIISHDLALQLNWIGANHKGSLQKLEGVLKLIYGAVRRNPTCNNVSNSDIDRALKNWLRNAPDREGGRANRKKP